MADSGPVDVLIDREIKHAWLCLQRHESRRTRGPLDVLQDLCRLSGIKGHESCAEGGSM